MTNKQPPKKPRCKNTQSCYCNENTIKLLKVLSEPNRLYILELLRGGPLCVCKIEEALKIPQSLLSHHLKSMKKINLIDSYKDGTKVIYYITTNNIDKLFKKLEEVSNNKV